MALGSTSVADLLIRVSTDTSKAKAPLDESASRVDKLGKTMGKLTIPAGIVVGTIAAFGKAAVDSASRAQQAFGAIDSVFGKNADVVKKWASDADKAVGLSRAQYGEFATVIGSQLKNMGLPMDQVLGKTNDLIKLGADLAATYGGTTAEAVEALSATMRGETDPIERYGVSIKQATIDAKMAADGTDKLTGAAAKTARTQATLALITDQTSAAQGQFARESESAAGAAQIQAAQMENMKATMGTALLPVMAAVSSSLGKLAGWAEKNATAFQVLVGVIGGIALAVLAVNAALKIYQATLIVVNAVQKATWLSNPIFLVIAAVILLVAAIVILWKRSETFRRVVTAVWNAVKAGALAVARAVTSAWRSVWSFLSGAARGFSAVVRVVFTAIRAASSAVAGVVKAIWRGVWIALSAYVRAYVAVFRAIFTGIRAVSSAVADAVKSAWSNVWSALKSAASGVGRALSAPFDVIKRAIDGVISAVQSLIGWLSRIKVPKISLPKIPGLGRSAPAPAVAGSGVTAFGAPSAVGLGTGYRAVQLGGSASYTIQINGLVHDPEGTARALGRIVDNHERRVGRRVS